MSCRYSYVISQDGNTALILASASSWVSVVRMLLEDTRVEVNLKNAVSCARLLPGLFANFSVEWRDSPRQSQRPGDQEDAEGQRRNQEAVVVEIMVDSLSVVTN